jgi:2-methylisocitrate lyase-like PEP mutase family enzyme
MEAKIRAATGERINPDTFIIARTDAREVYGMDEALRRGERYARAGADGLFIESPMSVDELALIGKTFDVPQLANMLEGGRTPILKPAELEDLGFRIVTYGISLMMRAIKNMQETLADIKAGEMKLTGTAIGFEKYKSLVGFPRWVALEDRYRAASLLASMLRLIYAYNGPGYGCPHGWENIQNVSRRRCSPFSPAILEMNPA